MAKKISRKSTFSLDHFKVKNVAEWNELTKCEKLLSMKGWICIILSYVIVIVTICAIQGFVVSANNELDSIEVVMEFACDEVAQIMKEYWKNTLFLSKSTISFFEGSKYVDRQEFYAFSTGGRNDILQAIEFIPYVYDDSTSRVFYENEGTTKFTDSDPADFRAIYPSWNYSIHDGNHVTVPYGNAPYFPVQYIEPLEGNEIALGYDLSLDPVRFAAINQSWIERVAVSSARLTLVQSTVPQFGFRYFTPLFKDPANDTSILFGFISATFKFDELLKKALSSNERMRDIDIFLFDKTDNDNFLAHYSHDSISSEQKANAFNSRKNAKMSSIIGDPYAVRKFTIDVGKREWTLACAPKSKYIEKRQTSIGWFIFMIGLSLAVAQTLLRSLLIYYKRRAQKEIHSLAKKHREKANRVNDIANKEVYNK